VTDEVTSYVGSTDNLEFRVNQHKGNKPGGTSAIRDQLWRVLCYGELPTESNEALCVERSTGRQIGITKKKKYLENYIQKRVGYFITSDFAKHTVSLLSFFVAVDGRTLELLRGCVIIGLILCLYQGN